MKTVVTVLSLLITCKALRFHKTEFLWVGIGISSRDCAELIGVWADVLGKLEGPSGFVELYFQFPVLVLINL